MGSHFQLFPSFILLMCAWLTPNSLASDCCDSPNSRQNLIHRTSSIDKTALPFFSPMDGRNLPLESMSSMLDCCVPSNRCSGFTQAGLSQWWQAQFVGKEPNRIANESRCARTSVFLNLTTPYPCSFRYLFHSQQFSPFSTFFQNLSISFSVKTIDGVTKSDVDEASITYRIFRHSSNRVKRGVRFFFL